MKEFKHVIKEVQPGSIAEEMELEPGDVLLEINNRKIEDVFDYRFLMANEYIELLIRKTDGEEWLLEIEKDYEADLGLEFENSLMSEYRSCCNKCIFCFIDQMPPGMRETLYFKDDDSRLSFMQGNYVTLTNMKEKDIDRIIELRLEPINISVQTTNPELRCKMLNNRFAGEKLALMDKLYAGGIKMNGQIVCCKGVNDGEELKRSIRDLSKYLPIMQSVSVVPVGTTKYREGLYPLSPFSSREAGEIIDLIEGFQQEFYEKYELHFIHASDEWYMLSGRDFPEESRYDGYLQLENGVGMMRLLQTEFDSAMLALKKEKDFNELVQNYHAVLTIATGMLAYSTIQDMAQQMMAELPGLTIHVYAIRNDFFGEMITVSGLITGQDLISQLLKHREAGEELGDRLLIPVNMLRRGEEVFLDDLTVSDVEKALKMRLTAVEAGGADFVSGVLGRSGTKNPRNDNFVYITAYDK